jgi:hypothetical protein
MLSRPPIAVKHVIGAFRVTKRAPKNWRGRTTQWWHWWHCRCTACGASRVFAEATLRRPIDPVCRKCKADRRDFTGKRVGVFDVIGREAGSPMKGKEQRWRMRCSTCGEEKSVGDDYLRRGKPVCQKCKRPTRPTSARNAAIVEAAAAGASHTELASRFGICRQRISQIVARTSGEPTYRA